MTQRIPDAPPHKDPACICPHAIRSAGRLYGISMGREWVRLNTDPGCPIHAPPPEPPEDPAPDRRRKPRRDFYLEARASMEAAGIDPDAFCSEN